MLSPRITVFHRAAHAGDLELTTSLLRENVAIDAPQEDGCTALWLACEKGHNNVVRLLCEHGADVNITKHAGRVSPLYIAAQNGHGPVVRTLLLYSVSIDQTKSTGTTPLFIAAQQNHYDIVRALLEAGADVEHRNHMGITPLMIAAYQGNATTVHLLLRYGADPHAMGGGRNTFEWAECGGHSQKLREVFEANERPNCETFVNCTVEMDPEQFGLVLPVNQQSSGNSIDIVGRVSSPKIEDQPTSSVSSLPIGFTAIEKEWLTFKEDLLKVETRSIAAPTPVHFREQAVSMNNRSNPASTFQSTMKFPVRNTNVHLNDRQTSNEGLSNGFGPTYTICNSVPCGGVYSLVPSNDSPRISSKISFPGQTPSQRVDAAGEVLYTRAQGKNEPAQRVALENIGTNWKGATQSKESTPHKAPRSRVNSFNTNLVQTFNHSKFISTIPPPIPTNSGMSFVNLPLENFASGIRAEPSAETSTILTPRAVAAQRRRNDLLKRVSERQQRETFSPMLDK